MTEDKSPYLVFEMTPETVAEKLADIASLRERMPFPANDYQRKLIETILIFLDHEVAALQTLFDAHCTVIGELPK